MVPEACMNDLFGSEFGNGLIVLVNMKKISPLSTQETLRI
jgi:hypothetical protein